MNILYIIMQKEHNRISSERQAWQRKQKTRKEEGKVLSMFAWEIVTHKVPSKIWRLEAHEESKERHK